MIPHRHGRVAATLAAAACVVLVSACASHALPPARKTVQTTMPEDPCDVSVGHIVNPEWCGLPRDAHRWLLKRGQCDHFRKVRLPDAKEDPTGEQRRQIAGWVAEFCTGTDAELARLREEYRDHAAVMSELSKLEDRVE